MTITQTEEQLPLLNDGGNGDGTRGGSYRAVEIEMIGNGMDYYSGKHNANGKSWLQSKPTTYDSMRDSLTYTWRDINVSALEPTKRDDSIWRACYNIFKDEGVPSKGRQILKNVTGIARPGELTVIMGSSGAGKTTLLNSLTFRTKTNTVVAGDRLINGYPVSRATITSLSAYVQQNELFLDSLTVREHLLFQAMVRMDENVSHRQRIRRVEDVIDELGLRRCEHTIIRDAGDSSGISGGERKRLSFASEVLTDPPMMFCDEPTSGLDSVMALNVISVLKTLARKGKTIVCTVHQPSSEMYSMFDKVILLAEGRMAFLGTRDEACDFFAELRVPCPLNYNPADYYIQFLAIVPNKEESCRETIAAVCDSFEQSSIGVKLMDEINSRHELQRRDLRLYDGSAWNVARSSPYKANWTSQFRAVIWRSWLCVIKDPMLVKMRLFQSIVVSIMINILYFQQKNNEDGVFNINGVIFTFLTNMTFQNVYAVMIVFCSELPIFLREHFSGLYRVDVYFICKTLAEIPMFLAIPVILIVLTYYTIGLNPRVDHFFLAVITVILVANVATSFGYFISAISTNVTMALSIGPPVIIPFLLFGGFLLNKRYIPGYLSWLSYLSWFKYGNEALLVNQWADIENIQCSKSNSTCPRSGRLVLEIYDFHQEQFFLDLLSLFLLILFFRLLAFLALFSKTLRKTMITKRKARKQNR